MSIPIAPSASGFSSRAYQPEQEVPDHEALAVPPESYGADMKDGELLELSSEAAAKKAVKLWLAHLPLLSERQARWRVNEWRRAGYANVGVIKDQDQTRYRAWRLPGTTPDILPALNKAATLCRRLVSILFADPPSPLVVPSSGEAEDVARSEFARRVLEDVQGETGFHTIAKARQAFDKGNQCGSGFVFYAEDPRGGGLVPMSILASPKASSVKDATHLEVVEGVGPDGQPVVTHVPRPEPMIRRYVRDDGTLTDQPNEAARTWAPFPRSYVLGAQNVRFWPHSAADIWDAFGVQVGMLMPYGEAHRLFPDECAQLTDDQRARWLAYRPTDFRELVPENQRRLQGGGQDEQDDKLVFVLWSYYISGSKYPRGCYHVAFGDVVSAVQEPWTVEDETGQTTTLLLPITQYKHLTEHGGMGHGVGAMELVGPGQEMLAAQVGAILEFEERIRNRKTFLPTSSILTPAQLRQGAAILPINAGGAPSYEEVVPVPREIFDLLGIVDKAMEDIIGLPNGTASGMQTPEVQSGRLAYAIISQVHAGLSEFKQNIERGYIRDCRIQMQELRRLVTHARQMRWSGEDGSYRIKSWKGTDLSSSVDVRIKPGTMTMLTAPAKADLLDKLMSSGVLLQEQYQELSTGLLGGSIGLEDDPFRLRVKGQVAAWMDGGQMPQDDTPDGAAGHVAQVDPTTGQVAADPAAQAIFDPILSDELPAVAKMRLYELARAMSGSKFRTKTMAWREPFLAEYERMRGIVYPAPPQAPPPAPPAGNVAPDNDPGVSLPKASTQFEAPPEGTPAPVLAPVPAGLR